MNKDGRFATERKLLCVMLISALVAHAQGYTWDKVRYQGGTVQSNVDPEDWNNKLTVGSETIRLVLKDGQSLEIPARSVTGLSYGQEAHRRVGTMVALGILFAPLALFGLFHKTQLHYIGIEYTTLDGKKAGLLLQGDKDNYRAILMAFRGATGAPVAVSEEDRKYVPTALGATVAKEPASPPITQTPTQTGAVSPRNEPTQPATAAIAPEPAPQPAPAIAAPIPQQTEPANVVIKSTPEGAEITIDGKFVGSTPSTLRLTAGDHEIVIQKKGSNVRAIAGGEVTLPAYRTWRRTLTVGSGSTLTVDATLEKVQ